MKDDDSAPTAEPYTIQYSLDGDDSLCHTIVRAVGVITNDDPETIEPLYKVLDPDALEELVTSFRRTDQGKKNGSIEFAYNGCLVTVYADGMIELRRNPRG